MAGAGGFPSGIMNILISMHIYSDMYIYIYTYYIFIIIYVYVYIYIICYLYLHCHLFIPKLHIDSNG